MSKKALLVASFGTSYKETREKTIDRIEDRMEGSFPEHDLYGAFTSEMIRRKIAKRDQDHRFNVEEALKHLKMEGYDEVVVQPTHILGGVEYEKVLFQSAAARQNFKTIKVGRPLLHTQEDYEQVIDAMAKHFDFVDPGSILFMGHGSEHGADSAYSKLNHMLWQKGYENTYVATVEGYPTFEDGLEYLKQRKEGKVRLIPFMIVAGDHAQNDMAAEEDSWKSQLEEKGYQVEVRMEGIGELLQIQQLFVKHAQDAAEGREILWSKEGRRQ
ncbi:MAG TPA: sirohydrochlorin cobaltochelatase [Eubacteriaceae bacterium]|nr:sirohydrochlorin cobaltochelatase [Eubacteriaceae bacterium]